jgi:hypothetical protein
MRRNAAWTSTRKKSQLFWGSLSPSAPASQAWRFSASRWVKLIRAPHSIRVVAMAAISTTFWSQSKGLPQ